MAPDVVYLDYNATTPAAPEVIEAAIPWLGRASNPSSAHRPGRTALVALDQAREQVAASVGARPGALTFTSGATESNNLAIHTAVSGSSRRRVLVSAVEHKAVLEPVKALGRQGWDVELLPVGRDGVLDVDAFLTRLDANVALVSLHLANNEVGAVQPLRVVTEAAHEAGALVHTDATQALGKIPVDLAALDVDLASFSGHKVYGLQGVGALFCRRKLNGVALFSGGGQERGLRPGTENVAGIVGFGVAAQLAETRVVQYAERASRQTQAFLAEIGQRVTGVHRVIPAELCLPNTLSLHCQGADGEALVAHSPGVAFSTGSACSSMVPEQSHVLRAILGDEVAASECVRISTGWPTTDDEIRIAAQELSDAVLRVRALNS